MRTCKTSGFVVLKSGCWQWIGPRDNGYGYLTIDGKRIRAHHWMYGNIGPGKELHHTCKKRDCVNPEHLIELTRSEHSSIEPRNGNAAKTHCKRGHELSGGNLYVDNVGARQCRKCKNMRQTLYLTRREQLLTIQA